MAKIIGGNDAPAGRYPYIASLQLSPDDPFGYYVYEDEYFTVTGEAYDEDSNLFHYCGGVLITPEIVLTGSICAQLGSSFDKVIVSLDCDDIREIGNCTRVGVSEFVFAPSPLEIGLAFLDSSVDIPTVSLAGPDISPLNGEIVSTLGWGNTFDARATPRAKLQEVELSVIEGDICFDQLNNISNFISFLYEDPYYFFNYFEDIFYDENLFYNLFYDDSVEYDNYDIEYGSVEYYDVYDQANDNYSQASGGNYDQDSVNYEDYDSYDPYYDNYFYLEAFLDKAYDQIDVSTFSDENLTDVFVCTIGDGKDFCFDDEGGPLIYRCDTEDVSDVVIGISGIGLGCALEGIPAGYVRVNSFPALQFMRNELSQRGYNLTDVKFTETLDGFCPQEPLEVDSQPTPFPTFGIDTNWICPASFFATNDGCDCECGLSDPDCEIFTESVVTFGCAPGEVCRNDACVKDVILEIRQKAAAALFIGIFLGIVLISIMSCGVFIVFCRKQSDFDIFGEENQPVDFPAEEKSKAMLA